MKKLLKGDKVRHKSSGEIGTVADIWDGGWVILEFPPLCEDDVNIEVVLESELDQYYEETI